MSTKSYHGSCHCGAIRWEADIDWSANGSGKCNCSLCTKLRNWNVILKPNAFRLRSGEDALSDYQWGTKSSHHLFCKLCGVLSFGRGHIKVIGGDYVSVKLSCIDDISPGELAELPVRFMNGRDNDWFNEPAETRHL
jgi:hypothetical protein